MRKTIIKGLFGGKILLMLSTQWKLAVYVFILIFLYITIHYEVCDSALAVIENNQILKELKTDYTTRYSEFQELTTAQRTAIILTKKKSSLHLPQTPPIVVSR